MQPHTHKADQPWAAPQLAAPLFAGIILGLFANIMALIGGASFLNALMWHAIFGMTGMIAITMLLMAFGFLAQWRNTRALSAKTLPLIG